MELLSRLNFNNFNETPNREQHKRNDDENINKEKRTIFGLKNYKKLTSYEYIVEIIKMISVIKEDENEFEVQIKYFQDIEEDYVFTFDNFIKMIMINMRMNARVPLIIMGETGCGKTSLIKTLASLKGVDMIIFNIHAGIDNNKII